MEIPKDFKNPEVCNFIKNKTGYEFKDTQIFSNSSNS